MNWELMGVILAVTLGVVLPILFWFRHQRHLVLDLTTMVANLTKMHTDPTSPFSTVRTNELLETMKAREEALHQEQNKAMRELSESIAMLAHVVGWLSEKVTGENPPPRMPKT